MSNIELTHHGQKATGIIPKCPAVPPSESMSKSDLHIEHSKFSSTIYHLPNSTHKYILQSVAWRVLHCEPTEWLRLLCRVSSN